MSRITKFIQRLFDARRDLFEEGGRLEKLGPFFDATEAFFLYPVIATEKKPVIRDSLDLKRFMSLVIVALLPPTVFGIWNVGFQSRMAAGLSTDLLPAFLTGLSFVLPLILVSYAVGFFWETLFAAIRKHPISEGLLVTGLLYPLTLPPDMPLWQAAVGMSFGIVIGKEIFGGSGSCGLCKCKVLEGGGEIVPIELPHLSRQENAENIRLSCQLKIREDMKIEIPPEIFSIKKFAGTVASNKNIGTFIKELVVDMDEPVAFEAGIYMQIDIPEYSLSFSEFDVEAPYKATWDHYNLWQLRAENDEPVFRAYSVANPPADNQRMMFNVRIATPPP
ncbi:MAG: RnfABCDGE type electron transport complex subunit D, partial [Thermodesulfobacteriota bacterium]